MINNIIPKAYATLDVIKLPDSIPTQNIDALIKKVVDMGYVIVGIGIFLAIIRSAYLMVSSQGDVAQFEKGKKGLIWSIFGVAIIVLSYFLLRAVTDFTINTPLP